MVNSETQARAISLGKALVQELGLEPGVDTLSRWMAHYITEQIAIAENTKGTERIEAEQRCFDTILKLWDHRSSLPNDRYPFKNFEPIFRALSRLDPDKSESESFYFDSSHFKQIENDNAHESQTHEVQDWVNLALSIDDAARILIDFTLRQAAHNAEDETTASWIEKSTGISNGEYNDISIIVRLVGESQEKVRDQKRRELSSRIEKLDMLIELSSLLRDELTESLENISDSDSIDI